MNADPVVVFAIIAAGLFCAIVVLAVATILAQWMAPLIEGWLARRDHRLLSALALSEDAHLPWEAKRRAQQLFIAHLDDRQRRSWQLRRAFEVTAPSGRRYTISRYRPFNVRTDDAVFCVQVEGPIPVYDKLLAQKLLIESDEQLFLARANARTFSRAWEPIRAAARARYPVAADRARPGG